VKERQTVFDLGVQASALPVEVIQCFGVSLRYFFELLRQFIDVFLLLLGLFAEDELPSFLKKYLTENCFLVCGKADLAGPDMIDSLGWEISGWGNGVDDLS
jgi:hypothetical protein